jgi:hypothetical protein
MQLLNYQIPNNPLKLLDDYLSSIPTENVLNNQRSADVEMHDNSDSEQQDATATTPLSSPPSPSTKHSAQAEQLHNSVLRVAAELFGNNISLLENSLALLEEQEQYQNNTNDNNNNNNNDYNTNSPSSVTPPIRTIRARRSGRVAVLVRKQQKKSRASSYHQQQRQQSDKQIMDDYYLCLLGRDRVTIDNSNAFKTSKGTYLCTPHHRIGMHCTCRSFFHTIKGSGSSSGGGGGRFKSNGERSPSRKTSYSGSSNNNCSIVCKHLLAVILMPHLLPWRAQGVEEDVVDDKLFAKLVMRASIG